MGVGVNVGVEVEVGVGVNVAVGVEVGRKVGVLVGVGVIVGPNNCPGAQLATSKEKMIVAKSSEVRFITDPPKSAMWF